MESVMIFFHTFNKKYVGNCSSAAQAAHQQKVMALSLYGKVQMGDTSN
jgi:hypothetical protein